MDELAQKDFRPHMTQAKCFRYRRNWWISLNKSGTSGLVRDLSDFNDALTTLNPLHQKSGERQLRPVPFWKYQSKLAPIIEFFFQLVAMERFLVELMVIQKKVAKRHDRTEKPVVCRIWIKPQPSDLLTIFLFCCSWIVYSWRRSTVTDGWCKDNTSQDHFRSVNLYKEFPHKSKIE